ncbi:hypothetical protein QDY65_05550 [Pyrococcus kukulkanii]|uniref:hypothetical protein n=1 Tax=Pyrococcus kukulkanii TaxID=1609559 RepID=UPI003562ADED
MSPFIFSLAFVYLDLILFGKYEELKPIPSEVREKMPRFGVDLIIIPHAIFVVFLSVVLCYFFKNALLFMMLAIPEFLQYRS